MKPIRPQIFAAMIVLGLLGLVGITRDYTAHMDAVVTGVALLGMKLLEKDGGE